MTTATCYRRHAVITEQDVATAAAAVCWARAAAWTELAALTARWRAATPFPHLVVDDLLSEDDLATVMAVLDDEVVELYQADLYAFDATAPEPASAGLRALRASLTAALAPPLGALCGRALGRADLRAFGYRPGHHLLPHTDHQVELGRVLAYIYYLPTPRPPRGGELELYRCRREGDELVDITSAALVEPRPNRLVVFEVGATSLHQVREVEEGLRLSLAGWFYP